MGGMEMGNSTSNSTSDSSSMDMGMGSCKSESVSMMLGPIPLLLLLIPFLPFGLSSFAVCLASFDVCLSQSRCSGTGIPLIPASSLLHGTTTPKPNSPDRSSACSSS